MLHRRLHVALTMTALATIVATGTIGATLPSADNAQAAAIDVVTTPSATTTVPVAAAAGIPADVVTLTVTSGSSLGALSVAGDAVTYTAPTTLPSTALTGPARSGSTATISREARPQLPDVEPIEEEPAPQPTSPTPSPAPPTVPTPTATPSTPPAAPDPASPSPTPTDAPSQSTDTDAGDGPAAPEPTASQQPAETEEQSAEPTPVPLLGTGPDAPAPGDHITYQVCTTNRTMCTDGTITVTFAPALLQPAAGTTALLEVRQNATFSVSRLFTNAAAADRTTLTASAARGSVKTASGTVRYRAPDAAGDDTVHVTLCSLGDDTACATSSITITVAPTFTTDTRTNAAIITDQHGVATVNIPTRSDAGTFDPASLTITRPPAHGSATPSGSKILLRLTDPTYTGGDSLTWRACAEANSSNCQSSTIALNINDGFGWVTAERSTTAGLTTTLDTATIAADSARWGLQLETVTLTGPNDVTISPISPGIYRLSTPANRRDPFTVSLCGAGRNNVEMCGTVRYTVTPIAVLPPRDQPLTDRKHVTVQGLLRPDATAARRGTTSTASTPAPQPSRSASRQSEGVDITWWVIGAAMLFGIGGGAGALRNRH